MNWLTRLHLRDTLLIIGVLPAAILALVLTLFFTQTIITDIEDNLVNQGNSLAKNLANASIFGVFTMNIEQLQALTDISVQDRKVLAAKILDKEDRVIVEAITKRQLTQIESKRAREFKVAIRSGEFSNPDDVGDLLMQSNQFSPDYMGSVVLTISTEDAASHAIDVKLNSFYIILFTLFVIALIASRLSKSISTPIIKITEDVQRISSGDYTPTTPIPASNELGTLTTGIHSMAKQLESHHKDLEMKIQLATHKLELQNADLEIARQAAENANELKSQFLAHMSHEIRTPMNGIMGFLEMLRGTSLNETQMLYLDTVQNSSRNLLRIINEVLDLSRLEAGKTEIVSSTFNLGNTIQECLDLLTPQAKQRFVSIRLNLAGDLPQLVHQDPVRLNQVLVNLLSNAIKFSYQSEVVLTVKRSENQPDSSLLFMVADQGCGISSNDLPQLFDPFTQFNRDKMQQGSGLGLAISKQIIDSMGGEIGVGSTPNVGSTFWFTFPFTPPQKNAESDQTKILDRLNIQNKHFLVADDNEINLHLLTLMLEKRGAIVDQAVDGQQAVDLSMNLPYDILMFDILMPNLSGTEALRQIRANTANPNSATPAVAITALPTQELQEELLAVSIQHCVTKPISEDDLGQVLLTYFAFTGNPTSSSDSHSHPPNEQDDLKDFELWRALQQMNGDKALIRTLLTKLSQELPDQLARIEQLIEKQNYEQARDMVHKVHGSAAYCATPRLKQSAKVLETALLQGTPNDIAQALSELQDSIERLTMQPIDAYL